MEVKKGIKSISVLVNLKIRPTFHVPNFCSAEVKWGFGEKKPAEAREEEKTRPDARPKSGRLRLGRGSM